MTALDWLAVVATVLFLSSTLLWGIPWIRFTERSRETRQVDPVAFRRTAIRVGVGALCSGFLLALVGFLVSFELSKSTFTPVLLCLGFVAPPVGCAVLLTSMFVMKVATMRALYKAGGTG